MQATSLNEIYSSINKDADTIYVVPLIRYTHRKTDYLYLLYEDLIKQGEYEIKTISVFNHFKLVAGILLNKRAILHYHWLEFQDMKSLLGMPWKMLCIYLFQLLGGNIVWTLHNEFPHDQKYLRLHNFIHKKMAGWADILHVHCHKAVSIMHERLEVSKDKFRLIPHPEFPTEPIPRETAIHNLKNSYNCNLNSEVQTILMFGNISRYKQIEQVTDIIINSNLPCNFVVAGPVKKGNMKLYEELIAKAKQHSNIHLVPNFIPEDHVPWFYSAAKICVFNYREILSSGGFHMAKAYNKTIIAPDLGCLSEMNSLSYVHLFEGPEELKELLSQHILAPKHD
jgi:glycosyltransferase involved in cell wall biosynthesis